MISMRAAANSMHDKDTAGRFLAWIPGRTCPTYVRIVRSAARVDEYRFSWSGPSRKGFSVAITFVVNQRSESYVMSHSANTIAPARQAKRDVAEAALDGLDIQLGELINLK